MLALLEIWDRTSPHGEVKVTSMSHLAWVNIAPEPGQAETVPIRRRAVVARISDFIFYSISRVCLEKGGTGERDKEER